MADEVITKRRVTMTAKVYAGKDSDGQDVWHEHVATDYVLPEELDAYVARAKASGWPAVEVSDEPDAGPGGYHGQTMLLDGTVRPATTPEEG